MKKFFLISLAFFAFVLTFLFGFELVLTSSFQKSLDKNLKIQKIFEDAGVFVLSYQEKHNKLPSNTELTNYLTSITSESYSSISINDELSPLPNFILDHPKEPFLTLWRGETADYYLPKTKQSTLNFDINNYFILRSKKLTWLIFFLCSLVFLACIYHLKK